MTLLPRRYLPFSGDGDDAAADDTNDTEYITRRATGTATVPIRRYTVTFRNGDTETVVAHNVMQAKHSPGDSYGSGTSDILLFYNENPGYDCPTIDPLLADVTHRGAHDAVEWFYLDNVRTYTGDKISEEEVEYETTERVPAEDAEGRRP